MYKFLVVTIFLTFLSACAKPAADFTDVNGNPLYLSTLQEKWLVVNYWATWCAPCVKEIPELNRFSLEHVEAVTVLGVNFDQPRVSERQSQVKKMKIEFPVFSEDPSKRLDVEMPAVLPTTYVFAPGGKLIKTLVGPQSEQSLLSAMTL